MPSMLMVCCNTCSACRSGPGRHRVKSYCNYRALLTVSHNWTRKSSGNGHACMPPVEQAAHTRLVQQDIQAHIAQLQRRLVRMRSQAYHVVHNDPQLADDARFVVSAPGFAELSATKLLAELSSLPDDMTPAQWVAHAGLDPRPCESGVFSTLPTPHLQAGQRTNTPSPVHAGLGCDPKRR